MPCTGVAPDPASRILKAGSLQAPCGCLWEPHQGGTIFWSRLVSRCAADKVRLLRPSASCSYILDLQPDQGSAQLPAPNTGLQALRGFRPRAAESSYARQLQATALVMAASQQLLWPARLWLEHPAEVLHPIHLDSAKPAGRCVYLSALHTQGRHFNPASSTC